MRVGVFGGTFDPIHMGHLIMAEQCREQACLDQVLFVPSALPPHKLELSLTPFTQRVEMLALAISGHRSFHIEELEKNRSGPSYTVDTLVLLQRQHPQDDLYFIVGTDSLHEMASWYQPRKILEIAILLVVTRTNWPAWTEQEFRHQLQLSEDFPLRYQVAKTPLINLSSREIRQRVGAGRSVRYLIPRSIEAYVDEKGLYREGKNTEAAF